MTHLVLRVHEDHGRENIMCHDSNVMLGHEPAIAQVKKIAREYGEKNRVTGSEWAGRVRPANARISQDFPKISQNLGIS